MDGGLGALLPVRPPKNSTQIEKEFKAKGINFKPTLENYDSNMKLQGMLGKTGWELVSVYETTNDLVLVTGAKNRKVTHKRFYFKRKISK